MVDHITGNTTLKTIEITVSPDGQSRVETKGFAGAECRDASKFIEQALGKQVSPHRNAGDAWQSYDGSCADSLVSF